MTYFPDLSPCLYFDRPAYRRRDGTSEPARVISDRLVAVGWLEPGHEFRGGHVAPAVREKLAAVLEDPWPRGMFLGSHECGHCRGEARAAAWEPHQGHDCPSGSDNLFVPGRSVVYVAPELVTHYIDAHGYRPPDEFCDAVEACPPMRSRDYFAQLCLAAPSAFRKRRLLDRIPVLVRRPLQAARSVSRSFEARARLRRYLREIEQYPSIDAEEVLRLARQIRAGDRQAFDRLVRSHLRLVVPIAREHRHRGLALGDLIMDGEIGLGWAAREFGEGRTSDFSSYAARRIRDAIRQGIVGAAECRAIRRDRRRPPARFVALDHPAR